VKADRRAQSARPRGMSLANSLREAKGARAPFFEKLLISLGHDLLIGALQAVVGKCAGGAEMLVTAVRTLAINPKVT